MKYLSVCSGIEAASVAWHPLGWIPVGFSEIEPFPGAVLAHHFPTTPNFGDMTQHEQWPIEPGSIDILVGGTPCQSFSVAGLRQGLKDPRGNLMLTFLAIAARLRPRWIVWENVPGVLSSNGGRDFGSFLGGLGQLGYGFAYRVLDAQWMRTQRYPHAVPQRRRRVFVVGCLGDQRSAAAVLFERESVFRNPSSRRATGQSVAGTIAARSGESRNNPEQLVWPAQVSSTLNASFGDKQGLEDQHALNGAPCFVPAAATVGALCARDYKGVGNQYVQENKCIPCFVVGAFDQQRQGQYGDGSVASTKAARGPHAIAFTQNCREEVLAYTKSKRAQSATDDETWVDGVVAPTQNVFDVGDVRATTVVIPIQDSRVIEKKQNGIGVGSASDPAYTIDTTGAQAIAIQGTVIGRKDHNGPQGAGHSESGEMFTLNSTDVHAVAFQQNTRDEVRLMNGDGQIAGALAAESGMKQQNYLASTTMQVRRLTPTECERLQGFPDGWTAIPWKKKSAEDCPDGPRYKALGNSMAVNCMEWIGERIAAVEARP